MIATALLLVVLLVLSGFFSGSEIALFSVSPAKVRALVEDHRRGARALLDLKSSPDRLLITILIGNNIANISAAAVATYTSTLAFGSAGVGLATGVMTLLVLFFGEITPKSFAAANAVAISLFSAPILQVLSRALFFLVIPLEAVTRALLPAGANGVEAVTEREIRVMTRLGHQAGEIEEHERRLVERAFALDRTQAWEVMTPRVDMFAWEDSLTLSEIANDLGRVPFSRIPVYGESPDDITGVLYLRDAYQALIAGQRDVPIKSLAREPLFVPGRIYLIQLLRDFQARRIHVGLVVDEHGGIDGLITLEDVLEELVGEIVDETDVHDEPIVRINRNQILVRGNAQLREINHFFNTSFPLLEHRSANGYLLDEFGRVPEPGEALEREGVRIEVLQATETQVTLARMTRLHPTGADVRSRDVERTRAATGEGPGRPAGGSA